MLGLWPRFIGGKSGAVFRGVVKLSAGSVTSKLIGIATVPILARIYGPADYGVMSVFTAMVTIIMPVLTLRYAVAVPLPRTDGLAMNVIALSTLLAGALTLVIALLLWMTGPSLLAAMGMQVLVPWWGLVVFGVLASGSVEIMTMWATRRRAYSVVAKTQVLQAVVGETVKLGLGIVGYRPLGLLVGQLAGFAGGLGSFLLRFRQDMMRMRRQITCRRMAFVARAYRGFPTYRLASHVLMTFSGQSLVLFSAARYDHETTGQLGMALTALALPINLIGVSVGNAIYGEAARLGRRRAADILSVTLATTKRLALLAFIPTAILMAFGPLLFRLVFGEAWTQGGVFASIFASYLLCQFVAWPIIKVLNVFNEQKVFLEINLTRAALLVVTFGVSWALSLGATAMVVLFTGAMVVHYTYTVVRIFSFISYQIRT